MDQRWVMDVSLWLHCGFQHYGHKCRPLVICLQQDEAENKWTWSLAQGRILPTSHGSFWGVDSRMFGSHQGSPKEKEGEKRWGKERWRKWKHGGEGEGLLGLGGTNNVGVSLTELELPFEGSMMMKKGCVGEIRYISNNDDDDEQWFIINFDNEWYYSGMIDDNG